MIKRVRADSIVVCAIVCSSYVTFAESHCKLALAQYAVCETANAFANDLMRGRHVEAVSVVQDVSTGAILLFAASEPARLDVSTPVLPLSLSKVFLAASWWDHNQPDMKFENIHGIENVKNPAYRSRVDVHEMLVDGSDSAGKQMAVALRKAVGTDVVLADLRRYGFNAGHESFWADDNPQWRKRLAPRPADASPNGLNDEEWGSALSIGESHMAISALEVSRFFQAVGNDGLVCSPVALRMTAGSRHLKQQPCIDSTRMMKKVTANQLIDAMLETVKRGTASGISGTLKHTGWSIGGKTGTGGVAGAPLNEQDGWFAGLIFDPGLKARFTVATFVRRGGAGGGNAAEISAGLARFLAAIAPLD
jgi:cell division protein FtsI/penicillin-binding protein 2